MPEGKLHANERTIDTRLVRRLLSEQFPQWADLPLAPVPSGGTDNAIYKLGADMAVRLLRIHGAIEQVEKEHQWLPKLAPFLPLAIPLPLGRGVPDTLYPWPWSVYRWLDGENATLERLATLEQAATDLANFIGALQQIDTRGGPGPGTHNFFRGVPLAERDAAVRDALAALTGIIDTDAATAAWEAAINTPVWDAPPVWIHGDLQSGNLLARQGRLSAVIDFGGLGIGDPACDLMVAWNLFPAKACDMFRSTLNVEDATWIRGRGWALSVGLIALPYYLHTSPAMVRYARHTITAVLDDFKQVA